MNGAHDMGGMHGFGPVEPEPNEPVFHGEWEKRAFALTLAMARPGQWNIDSSRFARENRDPAEYLNMRYYQLWFAALETMLKERDIVAEDEIEAGHALHEAKPLPNVLSCADVLKVLHRGGPTERETNTHAAVQGGRQGAGEEHQPPRPHAAAALRARARRHGGPRHRLSRLSRTATRTSKARSRNGFIACALTAPNCGARTATRR